MKKELVIIGFIALLVSVVLREKEDVKWRKVLPNGDILINGKITLPRIFPSLLNNC